jgi:hypothetical protein
MFIENVIFCFILQCIASSCNGNLYKVIPFRSYFKSLPTCDPSTYVEKIFPQDTLAACGQECNTINQCSTFTHGK